MMLYMQTSPPQKLMKHNNALKRENCAQYMKLAATEVTLHDSQAAERQNRNIIYIIECTKIYTVILRTGSLS